MMANITKYIILAGLFLLYGCKDNDIYSPYGLTDEGKKVMVSLQVFIPKVVSPVTKAVSKSSSNKEFTLQMEAAVPQTRSAGTTKLYNLWLLQFNADGTLRGLPHKISDELTAVNDMVLLDVPLTVAEDQTLYLVALGRQLEGDLTSVNSLSQLEELSFSYTTSQGGITRSKVTAEEDIPFAGCIKGATVVSVEMGGNRGQIEYNTPDGFTGGISIKRLMSKITLKYKFEVPGYSLDGMRMINANPTIRINGPEKDENTDPYVTLEGEVSKAPDTDGFYSVTWFTAQNQQGNVETILTESDRYYKKLENGTYVGSAPTKATHIEAWAYSITNPDYYAIYQMYVGKNQTKNFDVSANAAYNLRTTINTDIGSAQNDGRIRSFTATQSIFLKASGGKNVDTGKPVSGVSSSYDLDVHYNMRPLTIYTKGRIATIGIYTDENCTQLADQTTSWLKFSSSENYTDAYNNTAEPLGTYIKTDIIQLPTKLQFYLYSDEYIFDESGEVPSLNKPRRMYIRVETTTDGVTEEAIKRNSVIYYFDQRPPLLAGRFGGELVDGQYSEELCFEQQAEYGYTYTEETQPTISYLPIGYSNIRLDRDSRYSGVSNPANGRLATIQMAENVGNLQANSGYLNMANTAKRPDGKVVLYQYNYYNTFAARYCYDKNRDNDGNGYLDSTEIKWYMPGLNQLYGTAATYNNQSEFYFNSGAASLSGGGIPIVTINTGGQGYTGTTGSSGNTVSLRCVRNIKRSESTARKERFYIYKDTRGNTYGAIDAANAPNSENRAGDSDIYTNVPLYEYTETGADSKPVQDGSGNQVYARRMIRHAHYIYNTQTLNSKISAHYLIAPDYIDQDGNAVDGKSTNSRLTWANAMGYLATANSAGPGIEQSAVAKGCALYRGKDGNDDLGSWRLPTQREMSMIATFLDVFNNASPGIGVPFYKPTSNSAYDAGTSYWTASENPQSASSTDAQSAWYYRPFNPGSSYGGISTGTFGGNKATSIRLVRCIRDLPPK